MENKDLDFLPKTITFDLDGTLAPSKMHLQGDMAEVFSNLLDYIPMAVISGASEKQFQLQFIKYLPTNTKFSNLYIYSDNGAALSIYVNGEWRKVFEHLLTEEESRKIVEAFQEVKVRFDLQERFIDIIRYGHKIENRGSQITFSALGQRAPLKLKEVWDPDQKKRSKLREFLEILLPEFEIRIGGSTSIDVTKRGQNKAVAIYDFIERLKIDKKDALFIGDALFPGGNDEIAMQTGVLCKKVDNPQDTIVILRDIIKQYEQIHRESPMG